MYRGYYGWGWGPLMGYGWALGWLFIIVFLALAICVIVFLIKYMTGDTEKQRTVV